MNKNFYVYVMTNQNENILYTGVTNNLRKRAYQHKEKLTPGFTSKYNLDRLVYYEIFNTAHDAISREKQIKGGSRKKKIELINRANKSWKDLYKEL